MITGISKYSYSNGYICNTFVTQLQIGDYHGKIIVTQTARLSCSDTEPFKAQIIAIQQAKVYNNKRRCVNGLAWSL